MQNPDHMPHATEAAADEVGFDGVADEGLGLDRIVTAIALVATLALIVLSPFG